MEDGYAQSVNDLKNIEAEAGIIASVILRPEFTHFSEQLRPNYFTIEQNAYLYYAISELAKQGVDHADSYNIINLLNMRQATKRMAEEFTPQSLNELIENAKYIARTTPEDYMILVNAVVDAAYRRSTYQKLSECQRMCLNLSESDIEGSIYSTLDDVLLEFSSTNDVPQYKDIIDDVWQDIQTRQDGSVSGYRFKFPSLNEYATIEPGELFLFAASAKKGKSMMLTNCLKDLLRQDAAVLYIDSELNTRMFTCRMLACLTGIAVRRIKAGGLSEQENQSIASAIEWMKHKRFTHLYMPRFDEKNVYKAIKKVYHTQGIDVLIVDYFKSTGKEDAFATSAEMGRVIDMVKNQVCGDMDICGLGAVQATSTGVIADSRKIERNASTIALLTDKTPEEIENDGRQCGNKKLRITFNRNGPQMMDDEYIDLTFDGSTVDFSEAVQHSTQPPY